MIIVEFEDNIVNGATRLDHILFIFDYVFSSVFYEHFIIKTAHQMYFIIIFFKYT